MDEQLIYCNSIINNINNFGDLILIIEQFQNEIINTPLDPSSSLQHISARNICLYLLNPLICILLLNVQNLL